MRADRLISILMLLQVHRQLPARELAGRLEVSERTIHRDMEALSAAGIPVIAERGSGGGWRLPPAYRTNLTGLTEAEIQALFLTQPVRLLADLGLARAADAALIKLLAALPALQRQDAEYVRQRIHIDGAGWNPTEELVPYLPVLQDAIWRERKLRLLYQRGDAVVERLVDPLGLVAKSTVWYLVAAVEGEIRTYRVSRVQGAELTDEPCVRPAGFDLAAYWAESAAQFKATLPRYPALLRLAPDMLYRLHWGSRYVRVEHTDPPDADGWVTARVQFQVEEEACQCVLSLGPHVEVLEPLTLREQVIAQAAQVVAFYAQRPAP